MNFAAHKPLSPLRVLVANPTLKASEVFIAKMMSGEIFGLTQCIDLILMVYENEKKLAESVKTVINSCAYNCCNSITITSKIPNIKDADVFSFFTSFPNPNMIDFSKPISDEVFDAFYLLLKISTNIGNYPVEPEEEQIFNRKLGPPPKRRKPIVICDGLVAMDILNSFAEHIPPDTVFCASGVNVVARTILSEYFKVPCENINYISTWAANSSVFYVDIDAPILVKDIIKDETYGLRCKGNDIISRDMYEKLNMDPTQCNTYWMKSEYHEKINDLIQTHPYGPLYRSNNMAKFLRKIWLARNGKTIRVSLGVICDGSFGITKGTACVMPVFLNGDSWTADLKFAESIYVRAQAKKTNEVRRDDHTMLIRFCKKFLEGQVLNEDFVNDCFSSSVSGNSLGNSARSKAVYSTEADNTNTS